MTYNECPNLRIGPRNGILFTTKGYSKGVLPTHKFLLNSNVRAVILIPDLEKRKETSAVFGQNLKSEIIKLLICETTITNEYVTNIIFVCPPDVMFENWIISDIEGIKENNLLIKDDSAQKIFEGKNGTTELQKVMTTKYKKTVHAKLLFKKTRENISCNSSISYKTFIDCFNKLKEEHC